MGRPQGHQTEQRNALRHDTRTRHEAIAASDGTLLECPLAFFQVGDPLLHRPTHLFVVCIGWFGGGFVGHLGLVGRSL